MNEFLTKCEGSKRSFDHLSLQKQYSLLLDANITKLANAVRTDDLIIHC